MPPWFPSAGDPVKTISEEFWVGEGFIVVSLFVFNEPKGGKLGHCIVMQESTAICRWIEAVELVFIKYPWPPCSSEDRSELLDRKLRCSYLDLTETIHVSITMEVDAISKCVWDIRRCRQQDLIRMQEYALTSDVHGGKLLHHVEVEQFRSYIKRLMKE